MHRLTAVVVLTIMALSASACGSEDSASQPAADVESQPPANADPEPSTEPAANADDVDPADVDPWADAVAQLLADYYEAAFAEPAEPTELPSALDRWVDEATKAADDAQATIDAAPDPLGIADVDAAFATLLAAFERRRNAADAITAAIEQDRPALEAEIAATPSATQTPLLEGTSLEPLITDFLQPTDGRVDDACFALTDALIDISAVVLDCRGAAALVAEGSETLLETTTIETAGITLEINSDDEPTVRALTNGVQLYDTFPGCVWVGRPAGVSDPAGPSGFDPTNVGAMIEVPEDLGPWVEAHPTLALLDEGVTDIAGLAGVPYWDIAIAGENVFFVFVDSDPPNGCFVLGFDDRARLHLIPHENGPVLAITWLGGSPDPETAGSRLDELEALLDAITIIA